MKKASPKRNDTEASKRQGTTNTTATPNHNVAAVQRPDTANVSSNRLISTARALFKHVSPVYPRGETNLDVESAPAVVNAEPSHGTLDENANAATADTVLRHVNYFTIVLI
jgi:hypothetical protein